MRKLLVVACALCAGCLQAVDVGPGEKDASAGGADVGSLSIDAGHPGDAGALACVKDQDCPQPPSSRCNPVHAVCTHGRCETKADQVPWTNDPGACLVSEHCDCQELDHPECEGSWSCAAGRCSWKCGGCQSDLECPTGEVCQELSCGAPKQCAKGCRSSAQCPSGSICQVTQPKCGEPWGPCVESPSCTDDAQCPLGTACDWVGVGKKACLAGCHTAAQCPTGQVCQLGACPDCVYCPCVGTCQPKAGCKSDAECGAGQVCGTTTLDCTPHCLPGCHTDAQCRADQTCPPTPPCTGCGCDHSTCVPREVTCTSDAQCKAGQICSYDDTLACTGVRHCREGCLKDTQCRVGEVCLQADCGPCCPGRCEPATPTCQADKECPAGQICAFTDTMACTGQKTCQTGCRDNTQCKATEVCTPVYGGVCAPGVCLATPATCTDDAQCGPGRICEPQGPGCNTSKVCMDGCHTDAQCKAGTTCSLPSCLTCPCPGACMGPGCPGTPSCSTTMQCTFNQSYCENACCQQCPVYDVAPCLPNQCPHGGGVDQRGCALGPVCGACCNCPDVAAPVCGVNYQTYSNPCEAQCAGVQVLHDGPCLTFEGIGCANTSTGLSCPAGQYCRDACPMCAAIVLRCTKVGACVGDFDCPAGLPSPICANGQPAKWGCANRTCHAKCP